MSAPLPARLFGYDVLARLGEGAASVVYAVSDPRTKQLYALKHVVRRTEKDDRYLGQLENELAIGTTFRHPALRKSVALKYNKTLLRRIIDAGLVMEMIDGLPADQHLSKELPEIVRVFLLAGKALGALHYMQYVHCDFKPHNIMLLTDGLVKLVDFGQATRIGTAKERVQGTPDFIAPEQVKRNPVTEKTDIYCFGASLYWGLTGKRVPTMLTVRKSERDVVVRQEFPAPRDLNPAVPDSMSKLVMECVKVHPVSRPESMGEVVTRLEASAEELTK